MGVVVDIALVGMLAPHTRFGQLYQEVYLEEYNR